MARCAFAYDAFAQHREAGMSYDSARDRASGSSDAVPGAGGAPGKRSQTDRLTAPAGVASAGSSPPASTLSGTGWLEGLLGFTGSHSPTGECNCAGCAAGRAAAQGFNGPEDVPVNELKSEGGDDGGGREAVALDTPVPAVPVEPGADLQAQPASAEPKAPGQKAQPGQQAKAGQPPQAGQQAQPGQQAQTEQQAAAEQAQPGQAPGEQAAKPTGEGAAKPPPPPPTITSATRKAAPGGAANTRTTVGVGEVVDFTGSTAGTWTASAGTPATGASGARFAWTAPDAPATVKITLTVGTQVAEKEITVIAPSSLSMVVSSNHSLTAGTAGVCMVTDVTVGPTTVSFGNTEWLEVPGPATGTSGYFTKFSAATLYHNPNPNWLGWNDRNTGLQDHAAWHAVPPPYAEGQFQWSVPNKYRVAGSTGSGTAFTTTTQLFQMTDTAGTMSVSKAGASATRTP
jgi:hypothetical protein